MPGTGDDEIRRLEQNVKNLPSVTEMLGEGLSPAKIGIRVLEGLNPRVLDNTHVAYKCHCSRKKTEDILASLGAKELAKMHAEDPIAQVECHFCGKKYRFDIKELLAEMRQKNEENQ